MTTPDGVADLAAPLDALLIDAALGPARRFAPDLSTAKFAAGIARHPRATARRLRALGTEATHIAAGTSTIAAAKRDRRFSDPAWTGNPLLRRLMQAYLAGGRTAGELVTVAGLGWRDEQRMRFLVENVVEAASPSNVPLVNPASAKAAIDSAGLSLLRGGGRLVRDLVASPRVPEMVDRSAFEVGRDIAVTPGKVVLRCEVFELIQYAPQTTQVYQVPIMIVPPTINKFYAIDLAPERSLVEYSVRQGRQVFVLSWRNPDARHAAWNFDTYVQAILDALDAVERISGSERTVLGGICSGGILAAIAAAYLAGTGRQDRLAALCLAVTVIDNERAGTASALGSRRLAAAAKAVSKRQGYLDGRALAEVFAWMRPGDLVWNYWVNNYLLGQDPPVFDILSWNADGTNLPAALHMQFLDCFQHNALCRPSRLSVLRTPVDLSRITVPTYVAGAVNDHLTPWRGTYRTTQLLSGPSEFILSNAGHIQALVNPPGNPKASYFSGPTPGPDPDEWLRAATKTSGTWWTHWTDWLLQRSGEERTAPTALGNSDHPPLEDAPGLYVRDRLPAGR